MPWDVEVSGAVRAESEFQAVRREPRPSARSVAEGPSGAAERGTLFPAIGVRRGGSRFRSPLRCRGREPA